MLADVIDGVRIGLDQELVAPGPGGDGVADQGVVGLVGIDLVGLVGITEDDVLVEVFRLVFVGDGGGEVVLREVDSFDAALLVVFLVEPVHAGVGRPFGGHGVQGEFLDAFHIGRQKDDFPAQAALHRTQRKGDDLRPERDVVTGFGAALLQGEEAHHGGFFTLGLPFGHQEEIVGIGAFEGIVFGCVAEFERGGGPQLDHFLLQGAVQDIPAGHHDFGDLVGKIGEKVFSGGHFPLLGKEACAHEKERHNCHQSLHGRTLSTKIMLRSGFSK